MEDIIIKDEDTADVLKYMLYNLRELECILSSEEETALLKAINAFSIRECTTEEIIAEQEK